MPTSAVLYNLRAVLAHLYPDKASAIRVAQDADIPITLVALSDRAIDNWHVILQETEKQNRLAQLLVVVNEEYGANPQLRAVMRQLAGWPASDATSAVMGQQLLTLRRAGFVVTLIVMVAIIAVWINGQLTEQSTQPNLPQTTTATIAPATTTSQPTPASFTYGVTVLDTEGQPIPNAQVTIEIEGKAPLEDEADGYGFARIEVPAGYVERPGRLRVRSDGFAPFDQNIELYPDRLPNTVRLTRQ